MNNLEKKSFYYFLSLYIISSVLFILFSAYWYFTAQKTLLESNQYYKLEHISDKISKEIIHAHMQNLDFELPKIDENVLISLVGIDNKIKYGQVLDSLDLEKNEYFVKDKYNILVSTSPQEHLNIKYVVVRSNTLFLHVEKLKEDVLRIVLISILIIIGLAFILSRLFMKPIRQKIKQIEDFVHDTAHELNTPITALSMSVSRALKKESYDEKILKNISISTKQLFDIYNALSYLSFETKDTKATAMLNVCTVLNKSVEYYKELAQSKRIEILVDCEDFDYKVDEVKLTMLFGNLISNAIKYSHANSKIEIAFKDGVLKVKDYGIGINKSDINKIFERFNRQTDYSGGFGIGLSIVKKISQEYDINLEVESKIDSGSTFILKF